MGLKYHFYGFSFFENKEKAIIFRMEQFMLFNKFFILFFSWVDFCSFLKGPPIPLHL